MTKIPLAEQIAEIEAVASRTVEAVKSGALLEAVANERLPKQMAIWNTLKWLQTHEARIKAMLKETRE